MLPIGTHDSTAMSSTETGARGAFPWIAVGAAILVGLALRLPGLLQDPWIDEVWSWGLARSRERFLDVFTIKSSNNHALITMWIRIVGDQGTFFVYRLPSLVAGLACIPLAARIAGRSGRFAAIAAAWIVALSFLSIVFSSEARGYALLVACSLATFESAWTWIDRGDRRWLAASWACALVGVLSQTLFVLSWAAIAVAVVVRILRRPGDRRFARIFAFGALPVALFATWWFMNVRHVFNAGAPPWELATVATKALAWRTGLPIADWASIVGAAIFLGVLALDVRRSVRDRDPIWIAQVCTVVVVPAATAGILWDEFLAPRYFLVPLAFWCLSLARVIAESCARGGLRRMLALLVFAAFAAGNLRYVVGFVRTGRGHVGELVKEMAARATTRPLVVTGNYDFNVGAQIEWHLHRFPEPRPLVYVSRPSLPPGGAEFAVVDQPRFDVEPELELRIADRTYRRIATSIHVGPSGSDWAVYERVEP